MAIENPGYTVEKRLDACEIRAYSTYILAQVDLESDFDSALRNGFEILVQDIFGETRSGNHFP